MNISCNKIIRKILALPSVTAGEVDEPIVAGVVDLSVVMRINIITDI